MGFAKGRGIGRAALAATVLAGVLALSTGSAGARTGQQPCRHPDTPAWFQQAVVTSIGVSKGIPGWWADSPYLPRIVCWQGTGFDKDFRAQGGPLHVWHGIFAMTVEELQTIQGPWMIKDRNGFHLSAACFVNGWDACTHTTE